MISAIIIDDETHCINRMTYLLNEYCSGSVRLIGQFQSFRDGLEAIQKLKPQLVFLDVELDGKTGFDLLRELPSISFDVIFTTAHDKYAVQAFRFSAIDYLLKPVDGDELKEAVARLARNPPENHSASQFENLMHNLRTAARQPKRLAIPTATGYTFVPVSDIMRCQSEINYTTLYLKDGQKLTVAKTLREYEEMLTPHNFFRVHNSHLVNLAYIKSYVRGKVGTVRMADNTDIEVSTRRKEEFLRKLNDF